MFDVTISQNNLLLSDNVCRTQQNFRNSHQFQYNKYEGFVASLEVTVECIFCEMSKSLIQDINCDNKSEIVLTSNLSVDFLRLLESEQQSDVCFIVEGQRINGKIA